MKKEIKYSVLSQSNKITKVFDPDNNKIEYIDSIKKHREIKKLNGPEEYVRAYISSKLINELGYKAENIEFEKTIKEMNE